MRQIFSLLITFLYIPYVSADLVETIALIKPSVVGIGVYTPTGRPQSKLHGSGFVIGAGEYVVTNYHVVPKELNVERKQQMAIFIGTGRTTKVRKATVIAVDKQHDLAVLKVKGGALKPFRLAGKKLLPEGSSVAFTGFPIGSVLGLYPVTHRGIIAAITPTIIPVDNVSQISLKALKQLRNPYLVYQLDATAYPGNSGSALYDPITGSVIGVINKVFVQGLKESTLTNPSGITYAIPVKYLHDLLKANNINI